MVKINHRHVSVKQVFAGIFIYILEIIFAYFLSNLCGSTVSNSAEVVQMLTTEKRPKS